MIALDDDRKRQFEEYLRDGISAVKNGQFKLGASLLNRAVILDSSDARPYLWLSATINDPEGQIEYLEKAVAIDPSNTAARRGLAVLRGKIDPTKLFPEGDDPNTLTHVEEIQVKTRTFPCPRCGGRMAFSTAKARLACEYCGYVEGENNRGTKAASGLSTLADQSELMLDFVIPTVFGHRWSHSRQLVSCPQCGAISLLSPADKTQECPCCGSNQVIEAASDQDLIEPQLIGLMKVDAARAENLARRWLGKGIFSPDGLIGSRTAVTLRPGYYSFWTFDGTIEIHWSCEIAEASGNYRKWIPTSGSMTRFFDDILVPGSRLVDTRDASFLEPFDMKSLEEYKPDYLAGWPAVLYDRSLTDAALLGRDAVMKKLRPQLPGLIEIGREKRNINIGASGWSGMTFKHILLPIWMGEYNHEGKTFHLLINGQTGEVCGEKPRDPLKIVLLVLIGAAIILILSSLYLLSSRSGPLF